MARILLESREIKVHSGPLRALFEMYRSLDTRATKNGNRIHTVKKENRRVPKDEGPQAVWYARAHEV